MGRGVREVKGGMEGRVSAASPRLASARRPRVLEERRAAMAPGGSAHLQRGGGCATWRAAAAASPVSLGAPRCPSPSGARLLSANCFPFGFVSILPPLPSPFIFVLKVPFGVVTLRS